MTIDKLEYLWAESGTTTPAPTDEKIQEGFVGGDRPTIERFNWLHNRAEAKLNRIQAERVDTFYDQASDPQSMLMTGQWDEAWGFPGDDLNIMGTQCGLGGTDEYRAMCLWFDSDKNPYLIVANDDTDKFEVWDCRGMTNTDTSDDWHDDLPTGSGEDWQVQSICTDGSSVFGLFWDATNDTYQIQGWDVATWDVTSGWAATGTALPGTGPTGGQIEGKIIVASATKLATLNRWTGITAATDPAISIIDITDGTIDASGAGDAFGAGASSVSYGIASDGTNIYFGTVQGGVAHVCSALISNPQTGIVGWGGAPLSCGSLEVLDIVSCGPKIVVSMHSYAGAVGDVLFRTHSANLQDADQILRGQDEATIRGDYIYCQYPIHGTFDGINLWALSTIDDGSSNSAGLIKIDIGKFIHTSAQDKNRQLADVASSIFRIESGLNAVPTGADLYHVPPVFDGRDIWVVCEPDGSAPLSGFIFRLPLAAIRS